MSEESAKGVSPLRLRRPSAANPPLGHDGEASLGSAPAPAGNSGTRPTDSAGGGPEAPVSPPASGQHPPLFLPPDPISPVPTVGAFTSPPDSAGASTGGATISPAVSLRRRPSLISEPSSAPEPGGTVPDPPAEEAPSAPIKLRIGAKPPPPPAVGADLPDDLFPPTVGAPLVPLTGLTSPGGSTGTTPPPLPPMGESSPGSPLRMATTTSQTLPPGFANGGPSPSLLPLHLSSTRPPVALPSVATSDTKSSGAKASKARRDLLIFALVFVLLCVGGVSGFFYLSRSGAAVEEPDAAGQRLVGAAALPAKDVGANETPTGGNLLQPADVSVIQEKDKPGSITADVPPSALVPEPPKPASPLSGLAESAAVAAPADNSPPLPSLRFVRYAEGLNISGVFQGKPARALLDGRVVREGDVIEPNFGVSFVGVDAARKQLIFQDTSGAEVRVKY